MASYENLSGLQELWERVDPFGWNEAARLEREANRQAIQADYAAHTARLETAGIDYVTSKRRQEIESDDFLQEKKEKTLSGQREIFALSAAIIVPLSIGVVLLNR